MERYEVCLDGYGEQWRHVVNSIGSLRPVASPTVLYASSSPDIALYSMI